MKFYSPLIFAAATFGLLLVSGCGGDNTAATNKLVGKWEIDKEMFREVMKKEMEKQTGGREIPEAAKKLAEATLEQMLNSTEMNLEFKSGGDFVFTMKAKQKSETKKGTWEVVSSNGDELTLQMQNEGEKKGEGKVIFIDDDTIEVKSKSMEDQKLPEGFKMKFNRVK